MHDDNLNRPLLYTTSEARTQGAINSKYHPAFQFSVLTCAYKHATKVIYADGREIPYSNVKHFRFKYCELGTLEEFADTALTWLYNERGRFIIRGQLVSDLDPAQTHYRRIHERIGEPATIECPPRRWIVLDIDKARVPEGLNKPDKLAEAGYWLRDNGLPSYFRGVRCIVAATPSTGRRAVAHLRMFFVLAEPASNDALRLWATGLSEKYTFIDPSVLREMQPIYTARPIFYGCSDPVPEWGRVRILDGHEDCLELKLAKFKKKSKSHEAFCTPKIYVCIDCPDELLELTAQDAAKGVAPVEEISDKAWNAIKQIFEDLKGLPKRGKGRHEGLNIASYWLARLCVEGEMPEAAAREAYWEAVKGINNNDGKYDSKLLERHINDAFADVSRRNAA
jgi:hypothetical protein